MLEVSTEPNPIRLNLAAGNKAIAGWKSVGFEPHHDYQADIRDLSQFANNSVDELMGIHCIEHVYRWDVPAMLLEWKRVLKPGGMLAIECPDLIKCCKNIIAGKPRQEGIQGIFGEWELKQPLMLHSHGWTVYEMQEVLLAAGFQNIRFVRPHYHGKREHRDMRVEVFKP